MDDAAWAALTLGLTLLAGLWTWYAYRRRGLAAGMRGAALTLLPLAAYLTDTLRMFTRVADAVADWVTGLVLSPSVWVGLVLAGVAVVLFVVAGALTSRGRGGRPAAAAGRDRERLPASDRPDQGPVVDDDLADIEALLRRRGIE